jgi:ribosome assembly protein YihI (activator of Der GTPase)
LAIANAEKKNRMAGSEAKAMKPYKELYTFESQARLEVLWFSMFYS